MKKKVISVSNFGDETISDIHVVGGLEEETANKIAKLLNRDLSGPDALRFYIVVDNNKELYTFEP